METMSSYILSILKSNPFVLMSWGSHKFAPLTDDKGLSFFVNGFIYKGKVQIIYNKGADLFDVIIGEKKYSEISLYELVSFIDEKVEKNCNQSLYEEQVIEWLGSNGA